MSKDLPDVFVWPSREATGGYEAIVTAALGTALGLPRPKGVVAIDAKALRRRRRRRLRAGPPAHLQEARRQDRAAEDPHPPASLAFVAWIAARLGGWNCDYKPPGPKTMRDGWNRLTAQLEGYALASAEKDP